MNVLLRYLFAKPIVEAEELSSLAFVWIIFVGAATVYRRHGNISIDVLVNLFPSVVQKTLDVISKVLLLIINVYVTCLAWRLFESGWEKTTFVLRIPYTVFYIAILMGYGLMSIYSVRDLGGSLKSIFNIRKLS
jgi:TRAP-type C4-dicarboxylate transport system permease small subunit